MQEAMKRVRELKQETIDKSKQIPNSEIIVKEKLEAFSKTINQTHIQHN